jgi:hypothetical protein
MSTPDILKQLLAIVLNDHPEFNEEGTTGNDLVQAARYAIDYPNQDDQWPSRRWNQDYTDYIDLSGHDVDPNYQDSMGWPEK